MTTTEKAPKTRKPRTEKAPKEPRAPKPPREPRAAKAPRVKVVKAAKGIDPDAAPKEAAWPSSVRPSAMLLPARVAGRRLRQRAVKRSLSAVAVAAAVLGVIYIPVAAGASSAQSKLEAQQAIAAEHRAYLSENAGTQQYFDGFIVRRQAVAEALVKDVAYSAVIKAVNDANRAGAVFTEVIYSPKNASQGPGDPYAPSKAVGYMDVSGTVSSVGGVAELIGNLNQASDILTDPYVTSSAVGPSGTTFKLRVGFTDKAMSFKGEKFRPKDEDLATVAIDQDAAGAAAPASGAAATTELKDPAK